MAVVPKDMIIADVLKMDSETASILFEHGLHCLGCMHATGESLEAACEVHGIDVDALIADLNQYFASKE